MGRKGGVEAIFKPPNFYTLQFSLPKDMITEWERVYTGSHVVHDLIGHVWLRWRHDGDSTHCGVVDDLCRVGVDDVTTTWWRHRWRRSAGWRRWRHRRRGIDDFRYHCKQRRNQSTNQPNSQSINQFIKEALTFLISSYESIHSSHRQETSRMLCNQPVGKFMLFFAGVVNV